MSENQDELKVQIKAWLKQQNISRNDFAAECFVSPNTVRNWLAKVAIRMYKACILPEQGSFPGPAPGCPDAPS